VLAAASVAGLARAARRRAVVRRVRAPLAIAGVGGAIALVFALGGGELACDDPLGAIWTPLARARLAEAARSAFDDKGSEIGALHRDGCRKRAGGELTDAQWQIRQSCLVRRALRLDAATRYAARHASLDARRVLDTVHVSECTEVTAPAMTADAATVEAL